MNPRLSGVELTLGDGNQYIVPPLTLGMCQRFAEVISGHTSADVKGFESITKLLPVLYAAFQRNYPAVTQEQFADLVDLSNYLDVFRAVMKVSGMERAATPGESLPAVGTSPTM